MASTAGSSSGLNRKSYNLVTVRQVEQKAAEADRHATARKP